MSEKIAVISSMVCEMGWMRPRAVGPGRPRFDQAGNFAFEAIDRGSGRFAFIRRHRAQRRQQRRNAALLAERRNAHRVERCFRVCPGDGCRKFGAQGLDLGV
jgi:hypothetical protein